MRSTRIPSQQCPACREILNGATETMRAHRAARPGDFCLCIFCGALSCTGDDMRLRKASDAEEKMVMASDMGPKMLWARAEIRKRGPIPGVERRRKKRPR